MVHKHTGGDRVGTVGLFVIMFIGGLSSASFAGVSPSKGSISGKQMDWTPLDRVERFMKENPHGQVSLQSREGRRLALKRNKQGNTALILAAGIGHLKTMNFLLKAGVDIDDVNRSGESALIFATKNGSARSVRFLYKHGATLGLEDRLGRNALIWAALGGYMNIVRYLVLHGADMDVMDGLADSALSAAQHRGFKDIEDFLLSKGASRYVYPH